MGLGKAFEPSAGDLIIGWLPQRHGRGGGGGTRRGATRRRAVLLIAQVAVASFFAKNLSLLTSTREVIGDADNDIMEPRRGRVLILIC